MNLTLGVTDPVNKILWDESKSVRASGGFSLADTLPSSAVYLLKGAPLSVNFTSRVATLVKTAKIAGGTVANPTIAIGHNFKVGDIIADGVVALEIATITAGASVDTLAFTSGTLSTAAVGTFLYQAATVKLAVIGKSATATVEDESGDHLTATASASATGSKWNGVKLLIEQAADDNLAVSYAAGILKLSLAKTTAAKNNLAQINAAVHALANIEGLNFAELTFTADDWDGKETGATLTSPSSLFTGGVNDSIPAFKYEANALLSDNIKTAGNSTVSAVIGAYEIQESNLPFPVSAAMKIALTSRFQFV